MTSLTAIKQRLAGGGIESPALEARLILKRLLDLSDADLIARPVPVLTAADEERLEAVLKRRLVGEPLSRIFGEREFWGMHFTVTPDVLDPRADTETLIDAVRAAYKDRAPPARILDMGTGSGCILAAVLREFPAATGTALDLSAAALEVAKDNFARNRLADRAGLVQGGWNHDFGHETFDLILSNPPYIPSADIPNLDPGVRNHDPILALDGGKDGLDAYRAIIFALKKILHRDGRGFFEVGISQADDVARLVEDAGFSVTGIIPDLAGIPRVVGFAAGDK